MEGSSLLVSRGAKPWQGSGGSGARFWNPRGSAWEGSSLLVSRGTKPWQGRNVEGSGSSGARFWNPRVCLGRVVTFGFEGHETVAGAYSRGLWR